MDNRIDKTEKNTIDRQCMIQISSDMATQAGEKDNVTFVTEAQYRVKDGKAYLRYEESEISGMAGSKTLLKFDGNAVVIRRYGTVNSVINVEIGEEIFTLYRTQYGEFSLAIRGRDIRWHDEDRLDIKISYTMMLEGSSDDTNIDIHITEL